MGFADLHIHTIYSYDGTASVPAVLTKARKMGLDVIAITDHDEIAGSLNALELAPKYGVEVIPGIEVTTSEGDLLALNITERIERDRSLLETVLIEKPPGLRTIKSTICAYPRNFDCTNLICFVYKSWRTRRFLHCSPPHGGRTCHEKPKRLFDLKGASQPRCDPYFDRH